jgi:predicted Zn-dependent protease
MKHIAITLVSLLLLTGCNLPMSPVSNTSNSPASNSTPTPAPAPPEERPEKAPPPTSIEDSIVDGLADAIPLGKEMIRQTVKPIIDQESISEAEEMEIGDMFFENIKAEAGSKLDANSRDVAYVRAVGATLAEGVKRKGIRYTFHVIEDPTLNAFAIPGGHVFLYRGLLDRVIENEAQMAEVLGHEIGHIDAEHTIDFFKPIKAASNFPMGDEAMMVAALVSKLLSLTYGEVQESESDEIGTRLMFRAHYNPHEGATVHRRLEQTQPSGQVDPLTGLADAFLRTHPPSKKRALAIEEQATALEKREPGHVTYIGAQNYRMRTPVAEQPMD